MEYYVFKHPYVLIEDEAGKCQPFHKEYKGDTKDNQVPQMAYEAAESAEASAKKKKDQKKPGLCELCLAYYSDYKRHLLDSLHKSSIDEKRDYRELDALLALLCRPKRRKRRSCRRLFDEPAEKRHR